MLSSKLSGSLARQFSSQAPIQNVTIIGAGLMGAGIAQVSAHHKKNVILVDQNTEILKKSEKNIGDSIKRVAKKQFKDDEKAQKNFIDATLANLKTSTDTAKAVRDADLVIEAIVEVIGIKRKLFAQIEANQKPSGFLASNTSSLKLADIAAELKADTRKRFGGLHFFNPVPVMKLLEIVRHADTLPATEHAFQQYGKDIGKVTVLCKDTPGFIVNRLLVPYMFEALRLAERGDASFKDIDIAMKLGAGYPMGPFELCDYVGLDTVKFIQQGWAENYPDEPLFKDSKTLNKLVAEGKFGKKTGSGFYEYK